MPRGLRLRRILVPVDFSTASAFAARYAAQVASATGADVSLVHVAARSIGERSSEALTQALRLFAEQAGVWDPGVQVLIRYGSVASEILEAADNVRADLMIVPTRGSHRLLLPPIIGGTTRALLRSFHGMMLTVDEGAAPPRYPPRHITFVLLGNGASRRAFEILRPLLLASHAALTLIAVPRRGDDDTDSRLEDVRRHLEAYTGTTLDIETRQSERQTIARLLLDMKTDMILVGRNDEGEVPPNLLSPVVRRVVRHATRPVLSVVSARLEEIDNRFRSIARTFTREDLARSSTGGNESDQILQELAGDVTGVHRPLLLGLYGDVGLLAVLDRLGILDILRHKGFDGFQGRIKSRDGRDMGQLYCNHRVAPENLLVEVVEHVQSIVPHQGEDPLRLLTIEWVLMQNPRGVFTAERPPLPGQRKPGLGIGYEIAELFILAAERLGCEGLWSYPQFYHNARLYHERFHFVDAAFEGVMLALERDSAGHSLAEMSWAIERGLVTELHSGQPYLWHSSPQLLAISPRAGQPFRSAEYRTRMRQALAEHAFSIEWSRLPPPDKWPELETRPLERSEL